MGLRASTSTAARPAATTSRATTRPSRVPTVRDRAAARCEVEARQLVEPLARLRRRWPLLSPARRPLGHVSPVAPRSRAHEHQGTRALPAGRGLRNWRTIATPSCMTSGFTKNRSLPWRPVAPILASLQTQDATVDRGRCVRGPTRQPGATHTSRRAAIDLQLRAA